MSRENDPFYVGYLPLPTSHRTAVRAAALGFLCLLMALGAAITLAQREGGDGTWDTGHVVSFEGVLHETPYPFLAAPGEPGPICLVEVGKRGAQQRTAGLDGATVRCEGWAVTRDGRLILELAPEPESLTTVRAAPAPAPPAMIGDEVVSLVGEIVDYKCYLGAMKPGDGKGHKSCAALCIERGIPPVLVVDGERGREYYVLADADGRGAGPALAPFAGEPVRVTGITSALHGGRALRVQKVERAE